ncbi:MAG: hypothetical protein JSR77_03025 [Planctomycetes bacterium]|nr:hypothetical protein [Planctomycetota bacterium]
MADKAHTWNSNLVALGTRGIENRLTERGADENRYLGAFRWIGDRTIAWLHQFCPLRVCEQRRDPIRQVSFTLGCILICHRHLDPSL